MNYKRIDFGSHAGEYLVEVDGVKRILSYADIKELEAKEKAEAEIKKEIEPVTFPEPEPTVTVEPEVVTEKVEETSDFGGYIKKKKSRKKKE